MGCPNVSRFAAIGGFGAAALMGLLGYLFSNQAIFFASAALRPDSAVEGGNGRVDSEGIREHDHAAWRAAARDGEPDPLLMHAVDCSPRPFGQHFVMCNERPVHVGKQ
jgi:hypothetical protein